MPKIEFFPKHHQYDAIEATKEYPITWLCGGLGSGKSHVLVHWVYMMATVWAPGCDGLVVQPDFSAFEDIFMTLWRQEIPGEGTHWKMLNTKAGGRHLVIYNGNKIKTTIFVRSAMNIQSVVRIDGLTTITWAALDEPARMLCGQTAFEKTLGRTRNQHPWGHNPIFIVGSPRGFNWLTDVLELDSDHPAIGYTHGYKGGREGTFIRACMTRDNADNLSPEYESTARAFYGEVLAAQEFEASLLSSQGRKYPEWHKPIHVIPHALAEDLWDKRIVRMFGGVDWGHTAPSAVLAMGWTKDHEIVIIDEWYHRGKQTHDIGWAMHQFTQIYGKAEVPVSSGGRKRVAPWYCDPAEPDRIALLRTGFKYLDEKTGMEHSLTVDAHPAKTRGKQIGKTLKQGGIDEVRNLMGVRPGLAHPNFPIPNALGCPRIFVSDRCKNLIWEIPRYRDPPQVEGKPVKEGSDELGEDHACDAMRYGIFTTSVAVQTRSFSHKGRQKR